MASIPSCHLLGLLLVSLANSSSPSLFCKSCSAPGLPLESPCCLPLTPTFTLLNITPAQCLWPGPQPHQASAFLMSPFVDGPKPNSDFSPNPVILSLVSVHANFILLVSWAKSLGDISESPLCLHTQPSTSLLALPCKASSISCLLIHALGQHLALGWSRASCLSSALVFPQTLLPWQPE